MDSKSPPPHAYFVFIPSPPPTTTHHQPATDHLILSIARPTTQVGSFYLAVLLMRYVGLSAVVGVAHHHAIALVLFVAALAPLIPAWWILHELIDKTSCK